MAFIYREWRTVLAGVFAAAVITGAYFVAIGDATPNVAQASTETALLDQIATKDSTGDGLPDWEKALYGIPTDATTTDYFHLGMTDGEAVAKGLIVPVAATPAAPSTTAATTTTTAASFGLTAPAPGSLTDTFAQSFFALYLNAEQQNNGSLTDDQINQVADEALTELSASVTPAPDFKTAADIKVSGSGPAAMKTYAANAEAVFSAYEPSASLTGTDLSYLEDYLSNNTPSDLTALTALSSAYRNIATGLAALSVPQEAAGADLALINALARMAGIDEDFSNVGTDPLTTMMSLQQYPETATAVANAFDTMSAVFTSDNVSIPTGTPGAYFANAGESMPAIPTQTP